MSKPYTCARCTKQPQRCSDCRARRAEADRARRELKRAAGECCVCASPALPLQRRCELHQRDNAQRSGNAHRLRRVVDAVLRD